MIGQKNITTLFVSNAAALYSGADITGIGIGEVAVVADGVVLDGTGAIPVGSKFKVYGRNADGQLYTSQDIEEAKLRGGGEQAYAAPTLQVTTVGSATQGIIAVDDQDYVLHVFVADSSKTYGYGQPVLFASYHNVAGGNAEAIATGLAESLNKSMARMESPLLTATVVGTAADAYLQLEAKASTGFKPGVIRFDVPHFDVQLASGFGATPVETTATSSKGAGTYESVAYNEWFLAGNSGEPWRVGNYPKNKSLLATKGNQYITLSIDYVDSNAKTLDRDVDSFGTLMFASSEAAVNTALKTLFSIV